LVCLALLPKIVLGVLVVGGVVLVFVGGGDESGSGSQF
jgi:hypothetical protein